MITNNTFNIGGGSIGLYIDNATDSYTATGGDFSGNTVNMTHATSASVRAVLMRRKTASSIYSTSRDPLTPNIGTFENTTLLPVELTSFDAISVENEVHLSWVTLTERNNDHFVVEKSKDGKSFQFVQDVDGAGNSVEIKNYNVEDKAPYSGISYYRLRQIDFDGKEEIYLRSVIVKQEVDVYQIQIKEVFSLKKFQKFRMYQSMITWGKKSYFHQE